MTFTAAEIAAMVATQDTWMQDSCQVGTYEFDVDLGGGPTAEYVYGNEIPCGVNTQLGTRALNRYYDSEGTYSLAEAVIRLPLGTAIGFADRIRVTKRLGTACANVDYDLMGTPSIGTTCITCNCRSAST